jgi:hypothetical protein
LFSHRHTVGVFLLSARLETEANSMRRTDEAANQQHSLPASFSQLISALWRFFALVLVAATEVQAQAILARAAFSPGAPPKAERIIVVSIPDRKLALIEDGQIVKVYPIAVGALASPSPDGEFRVRERVTNPTYYAPGKVIPPGKLNPLGTRWIGLGHRGYGIHGTNEPRSIGKRASHGCIRMRNRDVEELFDFVRPGDLVELHTDRTDEIAQIFGEAPARRAGPAAPATTPAVTAALGGL